ncbi:MAG TPA: hypothetical protein VGE45_03415 [Chloroflexia bacterium]|jgi:hypothetical protein
MTDAISGRDQLIELIYEADAHTQPSYIFETAPEALVWAHANSLLDDPEEGYLVGPTLLEGIGIAYPRLQNKAAAADVLAHALSPTQDMLVFHEAQRVVLSHVLAWDQEVTDRFYDLFESSYRYNRANANAFIRETALEGTVMLPVLRGDEAMLHSAIGLLIKKFPEPPSDPGDAASLTVKAVKLLGRCYDRLPSSIAIEKKLKEVEQKPNWLAANEARFTLGIVQLYNAFRSNTRDDFISALAAAQSYFERAAKAAEGRTDAELFDAIARCYLLMLQSGSAHEISEVAREAQQILTERLLAFGGASREILLPTATMEARLVQVVVHLSRWAEQLESAPQLSYSSPRLQVLAQAYAVVREAQAVEGLLGDAGHLTEDLVLLPQVGGRFFRNREIRTSFSEALADPEWVAIMPPYEVDFYRLVLQHLEGTPPPKDEAAAGLNGILVAAQSENPALAEQLAAILSSEKSDAHKLEDLAWAYFNATRIWETRAWYLDRRAEEIADRITNELLDKLSWDRQSDKSNYLGDAVKIAAQYHYNLFILDVAKAMPNRNVAFLFATDSKIYGGRGGLGEQAGEQHLEGDFYNTTRNSNWANVIERQASSIAPGRTDLVFRFPNSIIFPIEVKAEGNDVSPENIHNRYVAQVQAYGMLRVSFLFVLDTTPKSKHLPLKNVADYCYIDHVTVSGEIEVNYVAVFVFPANRYLPSTFSP